MEFLGEVVAWFAEAERWQGSNGIPARTLQHLWLSVAATGIAAAIALPLALWLAHFRRAAFLSNAVINIGRAIPSFGVIVFLAVVWITRGWPITFWPLVLAMVLLALPPMFTNAYAAVADVDSSLVEAGRGMGFTERQVLLEVELPAASPVIIAGIRIAFVQVVATVALGAVITGRTGGLGVYIVSGFATLRSGGDVAVFGGALLVAALTLVAERVMTFGERYLLPPGLRPARLEGTPGT